MKKAADANEAVGMAEQKLVELRANHLLLSEATALASGNAVPVVGPAQNQNQTPHRVIRHVVDLRLLINLASCVTTSIYMFHLTLADEAGVLLLRVRRWGRDEYLT